MKKILAVTLLIVTSLMYMTPVGSRDHVRAANVPTHQDNTNGYAIDDDSFRSRNHEQLPFPAAQSINFSPSSEASSGLGISTEWKFNLYGSGIGVTGLIVQDLSGDGTMEIVAGATSTGGFDNNDYWYVLRQTAPNIYNQVWVSGRFDSPIKKIAVADLNNDRIAEIFIGLGNRSVHIFRGTDFKETAVFTVEFEMKHLLFADVDGNGSKEMIISNDTNIAAYNPLNYQLLWNSSEYGGDVAVGNVDADAAPEIVLSTGYVLNGSTRAVEWHYTVEDGFGSQVEVGDIDGDGIQEIAGAAEWYKITVFEADRRSPMWEITTRSNIAALVLADVNGDKRPEVLYGDYQWGSIHCIDGQTHNELWEINNPESGVTGIAVGNVDQDPSLEVLWGAGFTSTGPDYIYVADILSGKTEWQSEDLDGPLSAVDIGDVDDDGQSEIVMASYSSNSGYADSVIKIFNAETHEVEWQTTDIPNIFMWLGIQSIRIGDVDQDGETEFVIATADIYDGLIQIYNGRSHTLERQSKTYGSIFTAMEIGDVDGDSQTEIVVGTEGANIFVFNGVTAEEEWRWHGLDYHQQEVYDIHLKDIDEDGIIEIITSLKGSSVYVISGSTQAIEASIPTEAYALSSRDIDQNGTQSILVGRIDGRIEFYDGKTYRLEKTIPLASGVITCLSLADVDQNAVLEWLVCDQNRLSVFSTVDLSLLWQSGDLSGSLGLYNQIPVGQIDQDPDLEILLGSWYALYQFDIPWSGPLSLSHMTVSQNIAQPGELLTYTVNLINIGKDNYPKSQVDNPLPSVLSYVPNTLSASSGTAAFVNGKITWNGDLDAKSSIMFSYQVKIKQDAARVAHVNSARFTSGGNTRVVSAMVTIPLAYSYFPLCSRIHCSGYSDNFEDRFSGWLVTENARMKTEYVQGEYRILAKDTGYIYLIKAPTCKRQNYEVEVDAHWTGISGFGYGLIFGLTDDFRDYFLVMVNTDVRAYSIYYRSQSGFELLAERTYSSAILGGSDLNHLKVTRDGSQIILKINGSELIRLNDGRISGLTNVGLFNSPYSDLANADARFDNFKVTLLPEKSSSAPDSPDLMPETITTDPGPESAAQPFQDMLQKPEN